MSRSFSGAFKKMRLFEMKILYPQRFSCEDMSFGKMFGIHFDASSSAISIGSNVEFRDRCTLRSGMNSKLTIGDNVFFNSGCSITCFSEIIVGNDCQFGEDVKFYDHNHEHKNKSDNINQQGYTFGGIKIGNNCWFGSNVIVLKGVEIGDNAVIGAGCIIYRSLPSDAVIINRQNLSYPAS